MGAGWIATAWTGGASKGAKPLWLWVSNRGESALLAGESKGDSVPLAVVSKGDSVPLAVVSKGGRAALAGRIQ